MKTLIFSELSNSQKQAWLNHSIAPRPIALVSSIDNNNNVNLSPFSFFNLFSINPPVLIFSTLIKSGDNSYKDTYLNVKEVREVVVNICDYAMVQKMSLTSCNFPKNTDEFIKAGFTKESAHVVCPPMVKEAKIKLECKVIEVKSLGEHGGAGQLIICEILCMHIDESILSTNEEMIDQHKMDHVARLGADWYCKINRSTIFHIEKPTTEISIGIDALPEKIRNSSVFTGNNLGQLANISCIPELQTEFEDLQLQALLQSDKVDSIDDHVHQYVKCILDEGNVKRAWQVLLHSANS